MTIVGTERRFWEMVRTLREFEGSRCLWRAPVSGLLYIGIRLLLPVGGTVGGIYLGSDLQPVWVVVAAVLSLGSVALAARLARPKPWRALVADRLYTFEKHVSNEVPVLLRERDLPAARTALRSARLNPARQRHLGVPPDDAQDLDLMLLVAEPEKWAQSTSDDDRIQRVGSVFRGAGIRARVAGHDIGR